MNKDGSTTTTAAGSLDRNKGNNPMFRSNSVNELKLQSSSSKKSNKQVVAGSNSDGGSGVVTNCGGDGGNDGILDSQRNLRKHLEGLLKDGEMKVSPFVRQRKQRRRKPKFALWGRMIFYIGYAN